MRLGTSIPTLKVGSTAVAAIKRGSNRVYDADVAAFQQASNAADVTGILDLVDYLKAESLWDYARFYPMKSSQNAGSGSTVYGLGGLTSNNMTLVNSPTWGSDGVTFTAASSQYATVADCIGSGTISFWWRGTNTTPTEGPALSQYDYGISQRSLSLVKGSTGLVLLRRSVNGTSAEQYQGDSHPASDATLSAEWVSGGGRSLFVNDTESALILGGGTPVTERLNVAAAISLMSFLSNGVGAVFASGTVVLSGFIETAITTTQRETIADLINAL